MAANRVGRRYNNKIHSPNRGTSREAGLSVQKRQAREEDMPEEVNIDELLDLQSDEERMQKLKDILHTCGNNTEVFITELVNKLHGLQKQEDLHNNGIEHPQLHIFSDRQGSPDTERH
uniref:Protein phosphatase 1 regulatory subunit 14A-like n=2 Tax=Sinocyclocheilus rhinocerous TaxID=307959 RepID=A0A673H7E0_9TELE